MIQQHIQHIHNMNTNIMISRRTLVFSAKNTNANDPKNNPDFRPRRIILLRHGQSLGNVDESAYVTTGERYFFIQYFCDKKRKLHTGQILICVVMLVQNICIPITPDY